MSCELQRNDEGCEEIEGVLGRGGRETGKKGRGDGEGEHAFRKGRPRFVVFIIWEEEAWGDASCCMVGENGGKREGGGREAKGWGVKRKKKGRRGRRREEKKEMSGRRRWRC